MQFISNDINVSKTNFTSHYLVKITNFKNSLKFSPYLCKDVIEIMCLDKVYDLTSFKGVF